MSLDGLRAWIGEVERKLGVRTRVFLVLTVIAIGIAGAATYLAIDARESSVSEGDVRALQEQLEARIGTGGGGAAATEVAQLEAELNALKAEVAALQGEGGGSRKGTGASGGSGAREPSGGTGGEPSGGAASGATGGAPSAAKLQELLQQAKDRAEEAE